MKFKSFFESVTRASSGTYMLPNGKWKKHKQTRFDMKKYLKTMGITK